MITLDALQLPDGLLYDNEFENQKIQQNVSYSLGGRQFIQSQALIVKRQMTLKGDANNAWITRTVLVQLFDLADSNSTHTLTLHDGRVFQVRWDYSNTAISANIIQLKSDPDLTDFYQNLILRFIQV